MQYKQQYQQFYRIFVANKQTNRQTTAANICAISTNRHKNTTYRQYNRQPYMCGWGHHPTNEIAKKKKHKNSWCLLVVTHQKWNEHLSNNNNNWNNCNYNNSNNNNNDKEKLQMQKNLITDHDCYTEINNSGFSKGNSKWIEFKFTLQNANQTQLFMKINHLQ